jgi:hypothetical protein
MSNKALLNKTTDFIERNIDLFVFDGVLNWDEGKSISRGKNDKEEKRFFGKSAGRGGSGKLTLSKRYFGENDRKHTKRCLCGAWFAWSGATHIEHIRACYDCLEKIKSINPSVFEDLIAYHKSCQKVQNADVLRQAYGIVPGGTNVSSISVPRVNEGYGAIGEQFIGESHIARTCSDFPPQKGIYLIRYLNGDKWIALYCGKSENIKDRWKKHHRLPEIQFLMDIGIQLEFRYIAESPFLRLDKNLDELEAELIKAFKPKLNWKRVVELGNSQHARSIARD